MSHVGDDLLRRFVEGDLELAAATDVAVHLDACARCAAQAAVTDPLASAWASVDDPVVPEDLTGRIEAAVLAEQSQRPRSQAPSEIWVATGLMAAAALLFVALGDPLALVTEAASASLAVATGTTVVHEQLQLLPAWSIVVGGLGLLLGGVLGVRRVRGLWERAR